MGSGATPHFLCVFFLLAFSFALAVSKEKAVCGVRVCYGFCHFFEKKWRKKLPTGRFLSHIVRLMVKSAVFALFYLPLYCNKLPSLPSLSIIL